MKDNLSVDEIKQIKATFSGWLELQDEKKQISDAESDMRKTVAKIIEDKVATVNLLFKDMKARYNGETSDIDEVSMLSEIIRNNGQYAKDSALDEDSEE